MLPSIYNPPEMNAIVLACRDNELLAHVSVEPDGAFEIEQPSDGSPYSLIVLSESYPPIVLKRLVGVQDTLNLQLGSPTRYQPSPAHDQHTRWDDLVALLRSIDDARAELPADEKYTDMLTKFETSLLVQKKIRVLVPAYFYPDSNVAPAPQWRRFFQWAAIYKRFVEPVVILNIDDGSGMMNPRNGRVKGVDPNYAALVRQLNLANIPWVGYVAALHGGPRQGDIADDFLFWANNYPGIAGVFVDELPENGVEDFRSFCATVRQRLSQMGNNSPILIGNPGRDTAAGYSAPGMFNWICVNENPVENTELYRPKWADDHPDVAIGSITYNVKTDVELFEILNEAVQHRHEFLFITDQDAAKETLWTRMPNNQTLEKLSLELKSWNKLVADNKGVVPPWKDKLPRIR